MGISGPFGAMPNQKNNANEVPRWFSDRLVPKYLLSPKIIGMFGPRTAIVASKYAFWAIFAKYRSCRLRWSPVGWLDHLLHPLPT